MSRRFIIQKNVDPSMKLRDFSLEVENNNVTLHWEWPADRSIRMALVFECREETPDLETLINQGYDHHVVMRDLASQFTAAVPAGRSKFFIYPAYFDDNKNIAVCDAPFVTDWVYEKSAVSAQVFYHSLPLSQYHKAVIKIDGDINPKALTYQIMEYDEPIADYPIDQVLMDAEGHVFIKKTQTIAFALHPDYAHLIDLN